MSQAEAISVVHSGGHIDCTLAEYPPIRTALSVYGQKMGFAHRVEKQAAAVSEVTRLDKALAFNPDWTAPKREGEDE